MIDGMQSGKRELVNIILNRNLQVMHNKKLLNFLKLADKICRRYKETRKAQLTEYSRRVWL
jgi:hypothetical protein